MAELKLTVQIGTMVLLEVEGDNCSEIAGVLNGWESMNAQVERLCDDLARRFPSEVPENDNGEKQPEDDEHQSSGHNAERNRSRHGEK